MKKKQYVCSKSKKKLLELKRKGVPEVTWKLSLGIKEELSYIFTVIPCVCKIRTRTFHDIQKIKSPLLKALHNAKKIGKTTIVRRLGPEEIKLLENNRISYKPINYRIILR